MQSLTKGLSGRIPFPKAWPLSSLANSSSTLLCKGAFGESFTLRTGSASTTPETTPSELQIPVAATPSVLRNLRVILAGPEVPDGGVVRRPLREYEVVLHEGNRARQIREGFVKLREQGLSRVMMRYEDGRRAGPMLACEGQARLPKSRPLSLFVTAPNCIRHVDTRFSLSTFEGSVLVCINYQFDNQLLYSNRQASGEQ